MRHAKRSTLTSQDIEDSFRLRNVEVFLDPSLTPHCAYIAIFKDCNAASLASLWRVELVNNGKLWLPQPVYGLGRLNKDPARFVRAAGHADLFYIADQDIRVDQVSRKNGKTV